MPRQDRRCIAGMVELWADTDSWAPQPPVGLGFRLLLPSTRLPRLHVRPYPQLRPVVPTVDYRPWHGRVPGQVDKYRSGSLQPKDLRNVARIDELIDIDAAAHKAQRIPQVLGSDGFPFV